MSRHILLVSLGCTPTPSLSVQSYDWIFLQTQTVTQEMNHPIHWARSQSNSENRFCLFLYSWVLTSPSKVCIIILERERERGLQEHFKGIEEDLQKEYDGTILVGVSCYHKWKCYDCQAALYSVGLYEPLENATLRRYMPLWIRALEIYLVVTENG